ncbi:hypothetical protein B6D29_02195 [Microgenomates bacterium UTCPR1]|nr:hypothetical protein [Patescibacteria group bacterium]OQY67246.1 MAG: hypothetical protein B6D29_02195 [Microgenomates bacterium UTCPR1]
MSKKTKKEKILAAYRRKLRLLEQNEKPIQPSIMTVERRTNKEEVEASKKPKNVQGISQSLLSKYFFSDLKKSLVLVVLIIALEFLLYFANLIK